MILAAVLWLAAVAPPPTAGPSDEQTRAWIERGLSYIRSKQGKDGGFGSPSNSLLTDVWENPESHRSWKVATTAIVAMLLLDHGGDENRAVAERALDFVAANCDLKRPSDWDTDDAWGLVYGLEGVAHALAPPHSIGGERGDRLRAAGKSFLARLARRQSPRGGFGYYADAEAAWRSEWATTFTTSNAILAMVKARAAGLQFDPKMLDAAVRAVARCRTPSGAFTYDVQPIAAPESLENINHVQGSLGRIQVCNFALFTAGHEVPEATRVQGLELFFREHRFLECARMRPIPHEAYYRNAAYFFCYGHAYAGEVLATLPSAERARFVPQLRAAIGKVLLADGSTWDTPFSNYAHVYATAFVVRALDRTLVPSPN